MITIIININFGFISFLFAIIINTKIQIIIEKIIFKTTIIFIIITIIVIIIIIIKSIIIDNTIIY
jgi:hypothetical protein